MFECCDAVNTTVDRCKSFGTHLCGLCMAGSTSSSGQLVEILRFAEADDNTAQVPAAVAKVCRSIVLDAVRHVVPARLRIDHYSMFSVCRCMSMIAM